MMTSSQIGKPSRKVSNLPPKRVVNASFINIVFPERPVLDFFWKIHVSSKLHDFQTVLGIVQDLLMPLRVNFKFARSVEVVQSLLSFAVAPGSSGKLITIYPNSEPEALRLMELLRTRLSEFVGPEILTDMPFKDSKVVFFRYGRHKPTNQWPPVLIGPNGERFTDDRRPYFHLPSWITHTFPSDSEITGASVRKKYTFTGIIKHATTGNIYLASNRLTHNLVIIKEARKYILDGPHSYKTFHRKLEYLNARKLRDAGCTFGMRPIEMINETFSQFFIYTYDQNDTLNSFPGTKSPLLGPLYRKSFTEIGVIISCTLDNIAKLHAMGLQGIDISSSNLTWDGKQIRFIDLETVHPSWIVHSSFQTKGYWSNSMHKNSDLVQDYQKVAFLFAYLFANQNRELSISPSPSRLFSNFSRWSIQFGFSPRMAIEIFELLNNSNEQSLSKVAARIKQIIRNDSVLQNRTYFQKAIVNIVIALHTTISGTHIELNSALNVTNLKELSTIDYSSLPTGLRGLAGILFYLRDFKETSLSNNAIINRILFLVKEEVGRRQVSVNNHCGLRNTRDSNSVISNYLVDGMAGLVVAVSVGSSQIRQQFPLGEYLKIMSNPIAKSGGINRGLAGISLGLFADDVCHNTATHISSVLKQIINAVSQIELNDGKPALFDFDNQQFSRSFSSGPEGLFHITDLVLDYYNQIPREGGNSNEKIN